MMDLIPHITHIDTLIGKDFQEIADFQVIGYLMDSLTLFGI
jgi:hypothetical protein